MALYPPIVASSMPAFDVNDDKVKIYYTLPAYNSRRSSEIGAVHVTVRNQANNINILKSENEIIQKPFGQQDEEDKKIGRYYIEINKQEIIDEYYTGTENVLYRIQLRFSSDAYSNSHNFRFYQDNLQHCSEWSTVCIVKPIQAPLFYIDDFYTGSDPQETDQNNFFYNLPDFVGIYKQENSTEILKNWRVRLLNSAYDSEDKAQIDNYTLADSGIILNSADNYNVDDNSVVFSCSLPWQLQDGVDYKLFLEIQTNNGYYNSHLYSFTCKQINIHTLTGTFKTYINEEEGYVKLKFSSDQNYTGNLVIRRTDSKSNFLKWEDIKYLESYGSVDIVYYDFTVESGLPYRYLIQKIDYLGRRGTPIYDETRSKKTGIMVEWEQPFLLEANQKGDLSDIRQLKLKFDFQISSYKTNIAESRTDTIGSKYPFIRRNGNMYYRSFPITGTITGFMDEASLFTNKTEMYEDESYYNEIFKQFKGEVGNYERKYDFTYERKFREIVENFLYNSKPKLYKSMQEGNILIKLMEISLTPKNELNRLVYTFSATAYEIDQVTINSLNKYGLIYTGTFNPRVVQYETKIGQITSYDAQDNIFGNLFKAGQDIMGAGSVPAAANSIAKDIKYNQSFNDSLVTDFSIDWLRLTIESDPYLIIEQNNTFRPYIDTYNEKTKQNGDLIDFTFPIKYPLYQMESTYTNTTSNQGVNMYLGWLFFINGQPIIIAPPNNIYEINEQDFSFAKEVSIIPAKDTAMLVDYRIQYSRQEDTTNDPKNIRVNKVNGQLIGTYTSTVELISRIKYKYKYKYQEGLQKVKRFVNSVNTINIDTEPRAVIEIRTSKMSQAERFVVNDNGELFFDPLDASVSIENLRIVGINILQRDINNKGTISSLDQVNNPEEKDLYIVNGKNYYYYRSKWYQAKFINDTGSIDISCPVDALIFYFIAVEEDIF